MHTNTSRPVFHEGEREVQRRAGTERFAAQVSRTISPVLGAGHAQFFAQQPFVVIAAEDQLGTVWASPLVGGVGFARALDERHLLLAAPLATCDPLHDSLAGGDKRIGVIGLEPDTRTRVRVNGVARTTPDGILIRVDEAYGNCPKYIQRRVSDPAVEPTRPSALADRSSLDDGQTEVVRTADTFFIASVHPARGADASHRGGRPGFVDVYDDGHALRFPDYAGNRMFQTLGNIAVNPRVGLLFLDWTNGTAVQVAGRAQITWDQDHIRRHPGAERLVDVAIDLVRQQHGAMPSPWTLIEPWRHNPPVN